MIPIPDELKAAWVRAMTDWLEALAIKLEIEGDNPWEGLGAEDEDLPKLQSLLIEAALARFLQGVTSEDGELVEGIGRNPEFSQVAGELADKLEATLFAIHSEPSPQELLQRLSPYLNAVTVNALPKFGDEWNYDELLPCIKSVLSAHDSEEPISLLHSLYKQGVFRETVPNNPDSTEELLDWNQENLNRVEETVPDYDFNEFMNSSIQASFPGAARYFLHHPEQPKPPTTLELASAGLYAEIDLEKKWELERVSAPDSPIWRFAELARMYALRERLALSAQMTPTRMKQWMRLEIQIAEAEKALDSKLQAKETRGAALEQALNQLIEAYHIEGDQERETVKKELSTIVERALKQIEYGRERVGIRPSTAQIDAWSAQNSKEKALQKKYAKIQGAAEATDDALADCFPLDPLYGVESTGIAEHLKTRMDQVNAAKPEHLVRFLRPKERDWMEQLARFGTLCAAVWGMERVSDRLMWTVLTCGRGNRFYNPESVEEFKKIRKWMRAQGCAIKKSDKRNVVDIFSSLSETKREAFLSKAEESLRISIEKKPGEKTDNDRRREESEKAVKKEQLKKILMDKYEASIKRKAKSEKKRLLSEYGREVDAELATEFSIDVYRSPILEADEIPVDLWESVREKMLDVSDAKRHVKALFWKAAFEKGGVALWQELSKKEQKEAVQVLSAKDIVDCIHAVNRTQGDIENAWEILEGIVSMLKESKSNVKMIHLHYQLIDSVQSLARSVPTIYTEKPDPEDNSEYAPFLRIQQDKLELYRRVLQQTAKPLADAHSLKAADDTEEAKALRQWRNRIDQMHVSDTARDVDEQSNTLVEGSEEWQAFSRYLHEQVIYRRSNYRGEVSVWIDGQAVDLMEYQSQRWYLEAVEGPGVFTKASKTKKVGGIAQESALKIKQAMEVLLKDPLDFDRIGYFLNRISCHQLYIQEGMAQEVLDKVVGQLIGVYASNTKKEQECLFDTMPEAYKLEMLGALEKLSPKAFSENAQLLTRLNDAVLEELSGVELGENTIEAKLVHLYKLGWLSQHRLQAIMLKLAHDRTSQLHEDRGTTSVTEFLASTDNKDYQNFIRLQQIKIMHPPVSLSPNLIYKMLGLPMQPKECFEYIRTEQKIVLDVAGFKARREELINELLTQPISDFFAKKGDELRAALLICLAAEDVETFEVRIRGLQQPGVDSVQVGQHDGSYKPLKFKALLARERSNFVDLHSRIQGVTQVITESVKPMDTSTVDASTPDQDLDAMVSSWKQQQPTESDEVLDRTLSAEMKPLAPILRGLGVPLSQDGFPTIQAKGLPAEEAKRKAKSGETKDSHPAVGQSKPDGHAYEYTEDTPPVAGGQNTAAYADMDAMGGPGGYSEINALLAKGGSKHLVTHRDGDRDSPPYQDIDALMGSGSESVAPSPVSVQDAHKVVEDASNGSPVTPPRLPRARRGALPTPPQGEVEVIGVNGSQEDYVAPVHMGGNDERPSGSDPQKLPSHSPLRAQSDGDKAPPPPPPPRRATEKKADQNYLENRIETVAVNVMVDSTEERPQTALERIQALTKLTQPDFNSLKRQHEVKAAFDPANYALIQMLLYRPHAQEFYDAFAIMQDSDVIPDAKESRLAEAIAYPMKFSALRVENAQDTKDCFIALIDYFAAAREMESRLQAVEEHFSGIGARIRERVGNIVDGYGNSILGHIFRKFSTLAATYNAGIWLHNQGFSNALEHYMADERAKGPGSGDKIAAVLLIQHQFLHRQTVNRQMLHQSDDPSMTPQVKASYTELSAAEKRHEKRFKNYELWQYWKQKQRALSTHTVIEDVNKFAAKGSASEQHEAALRMARVTPIPPIGGKKRTFLPALAFLKGRRTKDNVAAKTEAKENRKRGVPRQRKERR